MISLNRREHDERCQDCMKNPVNFVPFSLKLLNFDDNSEIQRLFEMVKIYWCCFCWYKEHSTSIHNWIHSIKSAISFPSQMLYDMAMRSRPFFSSKSQSHRDFESNSEETHHHELSVFFSSETRENTSLYAEYDWFVAFFYTKSIPTSTAVTLSMQTEKQLSQYKWLKPTSYTNWAK